MKCFLLFPLFVALPLLAVEEAGRANGFSKMQRGFNDYRFRTNTPDAAISPLSFPGEVLPATKERLKQVWKAGKGRQDRAEALHAWMKELEKNANSTDAQVYLAWQAAHVWFAEHGDREHDLLLAHIRHTFSSPAPTDSLHLMCMLYTINRLEQMMGIGCQCDDFISLTDALNNVNPWLFEAYYPIREGYTRMDEYNRLWRDPAAYAPLYINSRHEHVRHALHCLLNDVPYLHTEAKGKGLRRWRDTWGKDLPPAVDAAMQAINDRRNGNIPKAGETARRIRRLTESLEPDTLGCVPRSILAAAPRANAWKPLWDAKASLYEMPDTTAISLPGWNLKLLSKAGDAPDKVLQADTAKLQELLQQAADNKTLPALLAFTLYEDDLVRPDDQRRSWVDVDGYDSFRAVFDIEMSPNFIDILIDEKGPHFSKDDAVLRAACRELNLTLHRCIVALALLEQAGDTAGVQQGSAALAELLNRTKTWPLVINECGLRSISPAVFTELVSRCQGKPALLKSFAEIAQADMAFTAALTDGRGKPTAERLAHYLRCMLVLRRELVLPETERSKLARQWMKDAQKQQPSTREGMEQYAFGFGAPEELLKTVPQNAEEYSGKRALRGLCLYRYAAEHGDDKTAEAIFKGMTADPLSYGYPATRLTCALRARRQGREAEARRFEKDALILWMAEERYSLPYGWWQSCYALLQAGPRSEALVDAVKLLNLNRDGFNRAFFSRAVPVLMEQGYGETASFVAEGLIHLAMTEATPANSCGTQRQIVNWRAMADIGHALHLKAKGESAASTAEKLLAAARPLLEGDAAVRIQSLTARAAALPKRTEPDGADVAAAHDLSFESPEYVWHLKDGEGGYREMKGRIEYAWYENETESCWVRILTESGRREEPALSDIATEDIKHLIDWRKRNNIEVFRPTVLGMNAFHAKLCRLYSDEEHPEPKTTYAEFLRPYGERRVLLVSELEPMQQLQLMKHPIERVKPALRRFTSLREAMVAADTENRSLRLCFLGTKGGETEKRFRREILGNDASVRAWNRNGMTLLCTREENGAWSAEAQEAFRMVAPTLDSMLPAGAPLRERFEQEGFIVDVPRFQSYGNRKAKESNELRIDIKVKPLFVQEPDAALCTAVEQGKVEAVKRLLAAGAHADSTDAQGYPMLYIACRAGEPAIVRLLLEHGANPQQRPMNSNDDAVLPIEVAGGNPAIIKLLTEHGAAKGGSDAAAAPGTELSPQVLLALLSQEDGIAAADEALAKNPQKIDWEAPATERGQTLLQHFVRERNVEVVKWLLEHGADANAPATLSSQNRNKLHGSYPLFYELCCYSYDKADAPNNYALLELFLKHGADANYSEDFCGQTRWPLGDCIKCNRLDLALLLLQYGADGNITTGMTKLPIFYALTGCSGRPENADKQELVIKVADALLEHGADPKQNAKKPWLPIREHTFYKDKKGNYTTSEPMRAWMEKHL